jgi:2-phospho-L-lactate guanylyltransferase
VGRPVRIIVPFKPNGAKSRLSSVLSPEERRLFAFAMLGDVLNIAEGFGEITILSRSGFNEFLPIRGFEIVESERDLNDALNELIELNSEMGWPYDLLIVMADLALITREDFHGILQTNGDVVLSPGRGGGTNMILIRDLRFRTCFEGISFLKHYESAQQQGLVVGIFASYRSGCDIDEPSDILEVLLHGKGGAKILLQSWGFTFDEIRRPMAIRVPRINTQ